jgi:hypothetical protein
MKFLFIMTVAMLLPFKLATAAWSDPAQLDLTQTDPTQTDPTQTDPAQLDPASSSTEFLPLEATQSERIQPLVIEQNRELISDTERANQLTDQAERINYSLDAGRPQTPQLRDFLNLPDGMIIRGSSRGGIGIGREY